MEISQSLNEEFGEEEAVVEDDFEVSFSSNIIELEHSFGYDCKRLFNLVLADEDTLIFASGNYLHYFSISRREVTFRKTINGHGIGFITKNSHPQHSRLFTVGENGPTPEIYIYEYPSHKVRHKLLGAAKACFTTGSYNSTGELFASQAGYPDFILTIWRWEKEEVVLRSKSFQSDILYVHFSIFNPILLVSSGLSHIKFWKMANTFTGLKLKGDLGRFGKTDFSDIYTTFMLSDENVISGCDWGNILLWEAGLIKFEICRKGRKPCHTKPITYISMKNGEVTTVGMDGYARVWYWESVDLADPPEDDLFVEIDPIYEFKIAEIEIRAMQKVKQFDENDFGYYAQDGNGGIWYCDINMYDISQKPYQMYSCIGGRVVAAETSPITPHLLALSEDGKIFAYQYKLKKLLLEKQFSSNGVDLLWFNTDVSSNGMELVAGFQDGVIRHLYFDIYNSWGPKLNVVRAFKAHTASITKLTVNNTNSLLVTGSADKSIFFYDLLQKRDGLIDFCPIGFVEFKAVPNCFHWHKEMKTTLLIGCKSGEVYQYNIPTDVAEEETYLSYNLSAKDIIQETKFTSVKSRIRRDINQEKIKQRKKRKRIRKLREIEKLRKANPGLQIDMETALADSEPDEEEEPLHIPVVPNPILWIRYTENNTIWVSMGGFDAGYIYELEFGAAEPSSCSIIVDGDDIEIHSYLILGEFLLFGMINGRIRINHVNIENFTDLSDYRLYPMHDALNGKISRIVSTYDGHHIVSVGYDGNIFLYKWHGPDIFKNPLMENIPRLMEKKLSEDILDPDYPSLEQEKVNAEIRRKKEAATAHDHKVLNKIGHLQTKYFEITRLNKELPFELRAPAKDLLIDARITKQIRDEYQAELDDVREELAYDIEFVQEGHKKLYNYFLKELNHVPFRIQAIRNNLTLFSFRSQALGEEHKQIKRNIEERLNQEQIMGLQDLVSAEEKLDSLGEPSVESFFFGRDPRTITPRFSKKMMRLLLRYRKRQLNEVKRIFDWDNRERQKPDPNRNHPDDDSKIMAARRNLGDYKLKIGAEYEPKATETLTYKYIEIVECRENLFHIINRFNLKMIALRDRKKCLYDWINIRHHRLDVIDAMLPGFCHQRSLFIQDINMESEFPDFNLKEHFEPGCGIEIDDILYFQKTVDDIKKKDAHDLTKGNLHKKHRNYSYEEVKSLLLHIADLEYILNLDELMELIEKLPHPAEPSYYEIDQIGHSPLLIELRYRWLLNLILEQDIIIKKIDEQIQIIDSDLEILQSERFYVKLHAEFMSAYMIGLNQELYILRDSEEIETQLLLNANVAMNTRNELQLVINSTNRKLDDIRKNIDKLQEQISALQLKFLSTVKGHKFFDFLRRIFKKKWKLPKPKKVDDESSDSSSSDSSSSEDEDADTKSVDSLDMATIRLDESTCPSGLERPLYELAFKMRSERHSIERSILENQRDAESRRNEIVAMQKKMKFHEEVYGQERNALIEFRRQRQKEINKVEMVAILRMDQLQHFFNGDDYRDLSNAVLFDADKLVELKRRVEQLNDETLATKRWHRINIVHLRRMNTDIKFMRYEITRLEEEIRQAMMKRFGLIINLDQLEEEVLRRYVFELETSAEEELCSLEEELHHKEYELAQSEEELVKETQTNTEKLNVLSVLIEEKNFLRDIIEMQEKNFAKWAQPQKFNVVLDIEKLMGVDRAQKERIECLEREICALRLKTKPLQMEDSVEVRKPEENDLILSDEHQICPVVLNVDAYMLPPLPDDFIMERIQTLVHKSFMCFFGSLTSMDNVRRYAFRAALYLGQAAFNFEGRITDRIQVCITEHLQTIVPKKYFLHVSYEEVCKLFNEILSIFDYERSDVNTEDVISGIYEHAKDAFCGKLDIVNRTQFIISHMFKELIEVLPLEEFQSEETQRMLVNILEREPLIDPRCIGIEDIINGTVKHARDNLLDGITAVPIRRLVCGIQKDLLNRRQYKQPKCTQSSLSMNISKKRTGNIF